MNTPLSWLKDYVPGLDVTDQEYRDGMTLSGDKVISLAIRAKYSTGGKYAVERST